MQAAMKKRYFTFLVGLYLDLLLAYKLHARVLHSFVYSVSHI